MFLRRDIEWSRVETLDSASRLSPQDQPFKYPIRGLKQVSDETSPEPPIPLHPIQIKPVSTLQTAPTPISQARLARAENFKVQDLSGSLTNLT